MEPFLSQNQNPTSSNPKKRKNILEEEFEVENWSRFIVLTSNQKPITKMSPFIIEKTIKGCAGEVKNVTKLRSGSLMVECFRKQQSLNLLALKHINDISISASPHRTLNSSRGIIRYRDDDLSELTDAEICKELEPQGITHVKRFISRKTGQEVKLNTFLITFNTPNIPTSIRIGLYNVRVNPYVPNPVRCFKCQKFGHGQGQCKGKIICFKCSEEGHDGYTCENAHKCTNCGEPHMASSKDCPLYIKERKIQAIKVERNISYPEARKFVSMANDSSAQKSYASVTKPVFTSVETQTDITWLNKADKPTRLTVKNTEKIITASKNVTNSTQTTTSSSRPTTTSNSKSPTSSNSTSHQNKKEQRKPKAQNRSLSQKQGKAERDPVQVHNKYGHLDDSEDESVWNLPPDDSPSPMDESPSETRRTPSRSPKGNRRKGSQRKQSFSPIRLR